MCFTMCFQIVYNNDLGCYTMSEMQKNTNTKETVVL